MTHEKLTQALYDYCLASAKITNFPIGFRVVAWSELDEKDPASAERWRCAVDAFLVLLGWTEERGEELVFDGSPLAPRRPDLADDDDPGDEHRITPDDG